MNRSWITALTLATVVGTGGAFVGVITASNEQPVAAAPEPTMPSPAALVDVTTPRLEPAGTVAYRLDSVGIVTVQVANGQLSVVSSVADAGWTPVATTGAGAHVETSFTDTAQLVTFTADLSGSNVMVSVTNVAIVADSQTVATSAKTSTNSMTSTSADTWPATTQPRQPAPASPQTAPASTTGDDHHGDDDGHEDHPTEPNDD